MTPADILEAMAATFKERGAVYGDNYKRLGHVMAALFPGGVQLGNYDEFLRWHLFELIVMKVTRLAVTDLTHLDSAHDLGVYAAMLEATIQGGPRATKDDAGHSTADEQSQRVHDVPRPKYPAFGSNAGEH
jgi:hypothetical protein